MARFEINQAYSSSSHKQVVEAFDYRIEGDYFIFHTLDTSKVLTIAKERVKSVDLLADKE